MPKKLLAALAAAAITAVAAPAAQAQTQNCAPGQSPPYCEQSQSPLTPAQQQTVRTETRKDLDSALDKSGAVRSASTPSIKTVNGGFVSSPSRVTIKGKTLKKVPVASVGCTAATCVVTYRTTLSARIKGKTVKVTLPSVTRTYRAGQNANYSPSISSSTARRFKGAKTVTASTAITIANSAGTVLSRTTTKTTLRLS